jgi:hypothetical protein
MLYDVLWQRKISNFDFLTVSKVQATRSVLRFQRYAILFSAGFSPFPVEYVFLFSKSL